MTSLSRIFSQVNGQFLIAAARANSPRAVEAVFGRTNTAANSKALRIAAEKKNYDAVKAMLDIAAGGILGPTDFLFGPDWDRVEELAKQDPKFAELMAEYDRKSDEALDEMLGGGLYVMRKNFPQP